MTEGKSSEDSRALELMARELGLRQRAIEVSANAMVIKDLDNLLAKWAISADGTTVPTLITDVVAEAQKLPPYTAPTGATGGSGSGG